MDCHSVEGRSPVCVTPNYGIKKHLLSNMASSFFLIFFFRKRPPHDARNGLWTLSPRWSAVHEPAILFPTGQRFSLLNHVTSGSPEPPIHFPDWSAVSHPTSGSDDVTSGHMTSVCARDPFSHPASGFGCYDNLLTNQRPSGLDQSETSIGSM